MSIGEVLNHLRPDFPEVSISKIRFLEAEGLIEPERTSSGYRKFSWTDLERLRYILTEQRDHYYPLKVIKERPRRDGARTRAGVTRQATRPRPRPRCARSAPDEDASDFGPAPASDLRMSRAELLANSGLTDKQLTELMDFGMLQAASRHPLLRRRRARRRGDDRQAHRRSGSSRATSGPSSPRPTARSG